MPAYTLDHVSDATLLAELATLVATDRRTTAALLAHLAEVDARELYLPAACSSMFDYCTRVLRLADQVAFKRIRAARFARRFPQLFDAIADGRLHVTGVTMIGPHLTHENVDAVIAAATHRSKSELEILIASLAPQPDLPTEVTPVIPASGSTDSLQVDPDPVAPPPEPPMTRVKPRAPDRFGLQVTISQATRDKLERAQALMRHRNPSGDLAVVLDRALDALLAELEKEKFGATSRPRPKRTRTENGGAHQGAAVGDPHYVPNDVRRAVHERDGDQCTFVSETGERCTERGFLELDHRTPVAFGGQPTVATMRVLCRAHNQYEATRLLGADFMRAKRTEAATTRATKAAAARATKSAAVRAANEHQRREQRPGQPQSDDTAGMTDHRRRPVAATPRSAELGGDRPTGSGSTSGAPDGRQDCSLGVPAERDEAEGRQLPSNTVVHPQTAEARQIEADVTSALRGMGFKAEETRQAMAASATSPATTLEERLRAALAVFARSHSFRCSDGPFEAAADRLGTWLSGV